MVVEVQTGVAPRAVASVPKTTFWAGGFTAWSELDGTTWHSAQATGPRKEPLAGGFRWFR